MKTQKEYWENRILDWEDYSYGKAETKSASLVERAAHYFRGPVRHRPVLVMQIVNEVKPKNVLELGCGSGRLAFDLVTKTDIRHVTGVDISEHAIQSARSRAAALDLADKLSFLASSVADLDFAALPSFDFVLGMGLTPYLSEAELAHLFKSIKNTLFLFDVHPKGLTFQNFSHAVYRWIKGHPFYNLYSKVEILGMLADLGISNVSWKQSRGLTYITNVTDTAPQLG